MTGEEMRGRLREFGPDAASGAGAYRHTPCGAPRVGLTLLDLLRWAEAHIQVCWPTPDLPQEKVTPVGGGITPVRSEADVSLPVRRAA